MPVFDLYSKRLKRASGDGSDVYVYDEIPKPLRVQVVTILRDALGAEEFDLDDGVYRAYKFIVETLCREYGQFHLNASQHVARNRDYREELEAQILHDASVERVLDSIELSFWYADLIARSGQHLIRPQADQIVDSALEELNHRFLESAVGYRFEASQIVRVDSELIHSQVVKPALRLLADTSFAGAQDEFLKAHEHYRSGNHKEALNEALKSLESLMKSICDQRGWVYKPTATAKDLIEICLQSDLVDKFWQSHFSSLRSVLESGVPTARNKQGAHGQGQQGATVPAHIVAYALHMTASAIVFLAEAHRTKPM